MDDSIDESKINENNFISGINKLPRKNANLDEKTEEDIIEIVLNNLDFLETTLKGQTTIPTLFIVTMFQRQKPLSENELYDCIIPRIDILSKPDGTKYKLNNLKKSISSTLSSTGIFEKVNEAEKLWYFKKTEAIHYLKRYYNKILLRNTDKNNNNNINHDIPVIENKVKKKVKKSLRNNNVKYFKVNNILDDLIKKYKKNSEFSKKLKNPFANCLTSFDIIKKLHGDENMILGVLTTYKFYKPLIKKMLKIISNKTNKKPNLSKLSSTIGGLESKIEMFQKLFAKLNPNDFQIKEDDS